MEVKDPLSHCTSLRLGKSIRIKSKHDTVRIILTYFGSQHKTLLQNYTLRYLLIQGREDLPVQDDHNYSLHTF